MKWDLFVSYASEWRAQLVEPFAFSLFQNGLLWTWFDGRMVPPEGDFADSIEAGLRDSRYGVIFASRRFFEKHWTMKELRALERYNRPLFILGCDVSREKCAEWMPSLKHSRSWLRRLTRRAHVQFADVRGAMPSSCANAISTLVRADPGANAYKNSRRASRHELLKDALQFHILKALHQSDGELGREIMERHEGHLLELLEFATMFPSLLDMDDDWVREKEEYVSRFDHMVDGVLVALREPGEPCAAPGGLSERQVSEAIHSYAMEKLFDHWMNNQELHVDVLEQPERLLEAFLRKRGGFTDEEIQSAIDARTDLDTFTGRDARLWSGFLANERVRDTTRR